MKAMLLRQFTLVWLVLALLILSTIDLHAQGVNSGGTDFWLGFMPNFPNSGQLTTQLFLASGTPNTVKVSVGGSTTNYTLTPDQGITADMGGRGVLYKTETPTPGAIHVTSAAPLTVYGYDVWGSPGFLGGSPDAYLGIPTDALGTEYYTVNYYDANFAGINTVGEFLVIATQNNTLVNITTTSHTRGADGTSISHNPGDSWQINLNKGEEYLVQSTGQFLGDDDLTGSHIVSSLPIAVISGHEISPITIEMSSADHLCEMMMPVDKWGTQYFDMPMAGRTVCGDYIRILSAENGNQITYNGGGPFLLDAGKWAEIPTVTTAEVYTSINHKKFIVAQYSYSLGYGGDPSLNADPFMICFTPQEDFEKRMIFRTPVPAKSGSFVNYLTVITQTDSLNTIKINGQPMVSTYKAIGKQDFPGTNPPMSATRVNLPNGSATYVATANVPFGAYEYGFTYYEGYGTPTGEALNIQSPDTLPPLQSLTQVCGDYTVHLMEDRQMPQFSFNDTRIAEVSLITVAGDPRWPTPSYNYVFTLDPNFNPGDSTTNFTLSVINPLQDAYAAVYTVDRAGNDTVYQYTYTAPKLTFSPVAPYTQFDSVICGVDSCISIKVTNNGTAPQELRNASILGIAQHGQFTVTPSNSDITLNDGQSTTLSVCYTPSDTGLTNRSLDYLVVGIGTCDTVHLPLIGSGVTPLIYATDLNFGEVDSGQSKCLNLTVTNKGSAPLTITQQDLLNTADFTVTSATGFPIVIQPGQSVTLSACFHPTHTGTFTTTDLFGTLNPIKFAHSIKDTSILIGQSEAGGALLTSYQEVTAASCAQKPLIIDTVYDPMPLGGQIDSVSITGPDAASFSLVSFSPGNGTFPVALSPKPDPGIAFVIQFDPTVKGMLAGPRTAFFNVYCSSTTSEQLIANLTADSKSPVLTVTHQGGAGTMNLGSALINQNLVDTVYLHNTGNDVLNLGTLTLTGSPAFTASPAGPYFLQPGQSDTVLVTFTSAVAGTFNAQIVFTPTASVGCVTPQTVDLTAQSTKVSVLATGQAYPVVFTCLHQDSSASLTNQSTADTVILVSIDITGTDLTDFQQVPTIAPDTIVLPQTTISVPIRFTPTATGTRTAQIVYTYMIPAISDSLRTITQPLTGSGAKIQEVVGAGSTTAPMTYNGTSNQGITIPFQLSQPFSAAGTNTIYGYDFTVSMPEDAFRFDPTNPNDLVAPTGITLTVVNSTLDPAKHIYTYELKGVSATPLTTQNTLATFNMVVMLDTGSASIVSPSGVSFLDQNGQTVCYVATANVLANFVYNPNCGDPTLKNLLSGNVSAITSALPEPNPFNATTQIGFGVNEANAVISVTVFDELGSPVRTLIDHQPMTKGTYSVQLDGSKLAAGDYFIRISDGTNTTTTRVVLQK